MLSLMTENKYRVMEIYMNSISEFQPFEEGLLLTGHEHNLITNQNKKTETKIYHMV